MVKKTEDNNPIVKMLKKQGRWDHVKKGLKVGLYNYLNEPKWKVKVCEKHHERLPCQMCKRLKEEK